MNKEQVIEANKLIAEFMGGKPYRVMVKSIGMMDAYQWGENSYTIDELQYHSSWDWLMPVVEKINKLGWYFTLDASILDSSAQFIKGTNFIKSPFWSTPLLATYNVVIDFIQWYNQQPK